VAADQGAGLPGNRLGDRRVGVAEHVHAVVAHGIQIAVALGVPEGDALAAHQRDVTLDIQRRLEVAVDLKNGAIAAGVDHVVPSFSLIRALVRARPCLALGAIAPSSLAYALSM